MDYSEYDKRVQKAHDDMLAWINRQLLPKKGEKVVSGGLPWFLRAERVVVTPQMRGFWGKFNGWGGWQRGGN